MEMDVVEQFIKECCEVGEAADVPASQLYEAYKKWCAGNGEGSISQKAFGDRLTAKGFGSQKIGGKIHRLGLRLAENTEF